MNIAPLDETITIPELIADPYPIYARLRKETPVLRVASVGRTFLTKARDTKLVKETPEIFSSDDPNTPMKRAFLAHTLMRKDGEAHALFGGLAGPFAARCLTHLLGITNASDAEMIRWSQTLIDGAGNFGWRDEIGGGINEPRDALLTILFGLLANPEQRSHVQENNLWGDAFDEAVRWVAPIQVSSRLVKEDAELGGFDIPKGDTVMTIQASANRDEDIWDNPENFDVTRAKHPHQAFGNGPHFCQGKHIARRMLVDIMLPVLFDRFPKMELTDPKDVAFQGFGFRGPINLPVILN